MTTTIESSQLEALRIGDSAVFDERQRQFGMTGDWFAALQMESWKRFQELPKPTRVNEKWRFANNRFLDEIDDFRVAPLRAIDEPSLIERSERLTKAAGRLTFVDDNLAAPRAMCPDLEAKGVVFTTLVDALARYPELVKHHFMKHSPELGSDKYEALHVAMLRNGVFVYVPKGVVVDDPFIVNYWNQVDGVAIFPHTLLVCEDDAKATVLEFQESLSPQTRGLVIANAHMIAGDRAQPTHDIIQNWSRSTLSFQLNTNTVGAETLARGLIINLGSRQARQEVHGRILGSDSNVEMYSLNVPRGEQDFDQRTLQTHVAPRSRSDLLYKNALSDNTRTIFSGLIIVEPDAQQTDAYQKNNNLMLSETAEANSLPGLEIQANDVKCSHGATSGRIDESELFYFLARGIPRHKAQELMVFGFFEEIISKFDNAELADLVRAYVERQFLAHD